MKNLQKLTVKLKIHYFHKLHQKLKNGWNFEIIN